MTSNLTLLLPEYLLGSLEPAEHARVERALETTPTLAAEARQLSDTFARLAADSSPHQTAPPALERRIRQSLMAEHRFDDFLPRLSAFFDVPADSLRRVLRDVDKAPSPPWQTAGRKGIHLLPVTGGPRVRQAQCHLVRLAPGTVFPEHRHTDTEWGLILQGLAIEGGGKTFAPGDIVYQQPDSRHQFRAAGKRPLVVALVLLGEIQWL